MKHFLTHLVEKTTSFLTKIPSALRSFFGSVTWQPPDWVQTARTRVTAEPKKTALITGAIVLGVALLIVGIKLLTPKPDENAIVAAAAIPDLAQVTDDALIPQPLYVEFSNSVAKLDQIGKSVTQGVRLEPETAGDWSWASDRRLMFTPKADWPARTRYHISLARSLFAPHVHLRNYSTNFTTRPFTASIDDLQFYINPKEPAMRQVTATLNFSHAVSAERLQKALELSGPNLDGLLIRKNNEPDFAVTLADHGRKAWFRSLPVRLPEKPCTFYLEIAKGLKPLAGAGLGEPLKKDIRIPDLYSFLNVDFSNFQIVRNRDGDPQQTLVLRTSVGVKPEQLLQHLSLYMLPKDKPARLNEKIVENYKWQSPAEIDESILGLSEKIPLKLNPSDQDYPNLHSITLDLPPGRFACLKLSKELEGLGGFVMKDPYSNVLEIPDYPREIRIMHDGSILAQSGECKLSVLTRGVKQVEYRLGKISPSEINHLVSQSEGNFQNPFFRNYSFGEDNISRAFYKTVSIGNSDSSKPNYLALDFRKLLAEHNVEAGGLFFLEVTEQPDDESTPQKLSKPEPDQMPDQSRWPDQSSGKSGDRRLILITNLGIIVKDNADGTHDLFVQSIQTGKPVAGASVQILGKNGEPVAEATTNAEGRASLARVSDLKREKQPVAFVVKKGADVSFLPFNRADRRLNFSRYETGGLELDDAKKLTAFLFTERGLYRPGDEVHIGLIAKQYDWAGDLNGLPLKLVITDPRDMAVHSESVRLTKDGFLALSYTPRESSPTGTYWASVYITHDKEEDELLGDTSFRVEEFLPDRLKIESNLSPTPAGGWIAPDDLKIQVHLRNLYGTAAVANRIQGEMTLSPAAYAFRSYPNHVFYDPDLDPKKPLHTLQEQLTETQTDDKGEAHLDLNLRRFEQGVYRLSYLVRGFEPEGGRNVATSGGVLVSAREFLIGCKSDGDFSYLRVGSKHKAEFLAIQRNLEPRAVDNLRLQLMEQHYISVLTQNPNGNYAYQSVLKEKEVANNPIALAKDGFQYDIPTAEPGDYVARIFNSDNTCLSVLRFSVVGNANLSRSLEKNAELKAKLSKNEYKAGENISVSITAPYTGAGLITIEREKVYASKWFQADTTGSTQSIALPPGLEGNAYVNITFVRSLDSKEIFVSPLSTAVLPFRINRDPHTVHITLDTPEKARPGKPFPIKFKTDRPGKIVVYAVDEGILQVAHYGLPDPLEHFMEKRALQVSTSQILDLILPEYSIVKALAAAGGDGGDDQLASNLNPFKRKSEKPVVFWSGVIDATGKEQQLTYDVPDYFNGTLRVMAVAAGTETAGAAEKTSTIQGPFVIQPNVPTFAAPGDEFEVTVPVANNVEQSGPDAHVTLSLATSENLELIEKPESNLPIAEGRDAVFHCKVKAREILGNADLVFTASLNGESAQRSSHLSVRPSSPFLTRIHSGYFEKSSMEIPKERDLYPQFRKQQAGISLLPLGFAWGLKTYLDDYPHLCSEQLTSRAFAIILVDAETGETLAASEREKNIAQIINILRTRQNDKGAVALWKPEQNLRFDFPSLYVMHFLTEAKEAGYEVPDDFFERGMSHLEEIAADKPSNLYEARQQAYAIYLITRNQKVATNDLDRLHTWLEEEHKTEWHDDLTALYCAASYAMLHNAKDADKIMSGFHVGHHPKLEWEDFYSDLGRDSQYLYILARHFPEKLSAVSVDDLMRIVDPIAQGAYNTHSAAYAIMGLKAYSQAAGKDKNVKLAIEEKLKDGRVSPMELSGTLCPHGEISPEAQSLLFKSGGAPRAFYQVTESGFDRNPSATPLSQGLEVQREYRNRKNEVVTGAALGEELTVHIKIRSLDQDYADNVAVVDLLPGGFEVEADSIRNATCEYADIREDRIVLYTNTQREVSEFVYKIRAVNHGQYQAPPVQAEAMYRPSLQARGTTGTLKVEN
ncbi:MAG: alpha-2-macroglobulin [Methylacidiphilales bacterium]|nr:alpha-2-macroglobulin [Candidatus Methylacidiphilales bacterium]